jgi:hypothetical protein
MQGPGAGTLFYADLQKTAIACSLDPIWEGLAVNITQKWLAGAKRQIRIAGRLADAEWDPRIERCSSGESRCVTIAMQVVHISGAWAQIQAQLGDNSNNDEIIGHVESFVVSKARLSAM